ncbi:hypothetical protein Tco_0954776 [Tanacetum coccineum]|uniref:Uncharacterized protein n=1 Tax=Tanacetum coccineum TaxID=301880 RepID=A0ABQ5E5C6_9ASTR
MDHVRWERSSVIAGGMRVQLQTRSRTGCVDCPLYNDPFSALMKKLYMVLEAGHSVASEYPTFRCRRRPQFQQVSKPQSSKISSNLQKKPISAVTLFNWGLQKFPATEELD